MDVDAIDKMLAARVRSSKRSTHDESLFRCGRSPALQRIWDRIEFHGIAPYLYLQRNEDDAWPFELWERISEEARIAGVWEATHQIALARVIEAFSSIGIPNLVMKGTALAYAHYALPEIRRRGDTDLLVNKRDLKKAREALQAIGWVRHADPHGIFFQENWILKSDLGFTHVIDLHWQASDRPIIQSILKTEQLFETAQPLPALCDVAMQPDLPLTLIQCVFNQHWHHSRGYRVGSAKVSGAHRLIWQLDIDIVIRALRDADWDRLQVLCEEKSIGPLIADALRSSNELLGSALPKKRIESLDATALDPNVAALLCATNTMSEFWLDLRTAPNLRQSVQLIGYRALPPRAHLEQKYPDAKHWATVMLRGRFLLDTALRVARKAISR